MSDTVSAPGTVPFEVEFGPLRQFCEVNFVGDEHYRSIELQRLTFDDGRDGHLVTMWRTDDVLDIYADPGLRLDEAWWRREPALADIAMGELVDSDLSRASMRTGANGCDTRLEFVDRHGRTIALKARSASPKVDSRRLFVPSVLRRKAELLRFLYIFELGPLSPDDEVRVTIDGAAMTPSRWMWPLSWRRHLQARHGDDMVLFSINPPRTRAHEVADAEVVCTPDGNAVLEWAAEEVGHRVSLEFNPPIPLLGLDASGTSELRVCIDGEQVGSGQVRVDGDRVRITNARQSWRPPTKDLSVWALELVRRMKSRGQAWEWSGTFVDGIADGSWQRTETNDEAAS